ncbi:forkhead box protein N3-like [Limulus polyphemus]|uniref:Forkhead box protein N3 n=1 Tax=Limulus polyphemus TaxID=6850 RepID=A0ABM1T632_LIMPO|nr:forkhead box protein N3-like [Limulus polyphemus]
MKKRKIFFSMATRQAFEVCSQIGVSTPLMFSIDDGTTNIIEVTNGYDKTIDNNSPSEKECFEDDELTNLTWLQDTNLLKNIHMDTCGEVKEILNASTTSDFVLNAKEEGNIEVEGSAECSFSTKASSFGEPYNPHIHINAKPPYSFSCLIFMAIEDSPVKALPVKDIYSWIVDHFPYFRNAQTGWKNSVRHNLSLNKCFSKVDKIKSQNIGKGSLWCIDPQFRPNLLQALRKSLSSSFPHMPRLDCILHFSQSDVDIDCDKPLPLLSTRTYINLPSSELFPCSSKGFNASTVKDPEVDAAATMLALKNSPSECSFDTYGEKYKNTISSSEWKLGQKRLRFRDSASGLQTKYHCSEPLLITSSPSEDHTYSDSLIAGGSWSSDISPTTFRFNASDGKHQNSDNTFQNNHQSSRGAVRQKAKVNSDCSLNSPLKSFVRKRLKIGSTDTEDEQVLAEGAYALLNFVRIATSKRYMFKLNSKLAEKTLSDA